MGEGGVPSKNIGKDLTPRPGNTLTVSAARSYRSDTERMEGQRKVVRLAVVVEVEATEEEARGTFTLKLWSQEGGARGEFFDGVTFP